MDSSQLTRMRNEAANRYIATAGVPVDSSLQTLRLANRSGRAPVSATGAPTLPSMTAGVVSTCCDKDDPYRLASSGSGSTVYSSDRVALKNAACAESCGPLPFLVELTPAWCCNPAETAAMKLNPVKGIQCGSQPAEQRRYVPTECCGCDELKCVSNPKVFPPS
jgi:hypothetical protein